MDGGESSQFQASDFQTLDIPPITDFPELHDVNKRGPVIDQQEISNESADTSESISCSQLITDLATYSMQDFDNLRTKSLKTYPDSTDPLITFQSRNKRSKLTKPSVPLKSAWGYEQIKKANIISTVHRSLELDDELSKSENSDDSAILGNYINNSCAASAIVQNNDDVRTTLTSDCNKTYLNLVTQPSCNKKRRNLARRKEIRGSNSFSENRNSKDIKPQDSEGVQDLIEHKCNSVNTLFGSYKPQEVEIPDMEGAQLSTDCREYRMLSQHETSRNADILLTEDISKATMSVIDNLDILCNDPENSIKNSFKNTDSNETHYDYKKEARRSFVSNPQVGKKVTKTSKRTSSRAQSGTTKPHSCHHCSKRFALSAKLKRHVRTHIGIKPHACRVCSKAFSEKHNLVTHMLTHSKEKPHACDVCGRAFSLKSNLRRHRRDHPKEKFTCDVCGKGYYLNAKLMLHKRTHTNEKPYNCDVCGKAFRKNSNSVRHMKTHSNEKPHRCNLCDYAAKQRYQLKRHKQRHHTK